MNTWIKLYHLIHNCSMLSVCARPVGCMLWLTLLVVVAI